MKREEILEELRGTMFELFEIAPERLQLDTRLREDLDLDSIDAVDMAAALQKASGKRVPMSALMRIRSVSDVVDLIERELVAGSGDEVPSASSPED